MAVSLNREEMLFGAVAQLGERLICIQEVVGSIPSGSTIHLAHANGFAIAARARRLAPAAYSVARSTAVRNEWQAVSTV